MLTQSPDGVPANQSCMWSMAADAAEAADDAPRASMMAAPRCCTVGMKLASTHSWSLMRSAADFPLISALNRSGYWVAEWLPQMVTRFTLATGTTALAAMW